MAAMRPRIGHWLPTDHAEKPKGYEHYGTGRTCGAGMRNPRLPTGSSVQLAAVRGDRPERYLQASRDYL